MSASHARAHGSGVPYAAGMDLVISNHALIRYAERVMGIDLTEVRKICRFDEEIIAEMKFAGIDVEAFRRRVRDEVQPHYRKGLERFVVGCMTYRVASGIVVTCCEATRVATTPCPEKRRRTHDWEMKKWQREVRWNSHDRRNMRSERQMTKADVWKEARNA